MRKCKVCENSNIERKYIYCWLYRLYNRRDRSSIGYFISQNRDLQVSNVFLLGYNDVIERLYNSLNDNIYANIEILKPYEILYKQYSLRKNYNYNPAEYAIAFSLALHGLEAG